MKKAMILLIVLSLVTLSIPINEANAENKQALISVDSLNVRSGPGLSYDVIASVKKDESYEILSTDSEWVKIKLTGGKEGWVAGWFISTVTNEAPTNTKTDKLQATVDQLRIRSGPGTNFQVIGFINKNDSPLYIEKSEKWIKISFKDYVGWVHSDYLVGVPEANIKKKEEKQITNNAKGIVKATILNVRETASLTSPIIGKVKKGDTLNILSNQHEWYEVSITNGKGWVHQDYITVTTESDSREEPDGNDSLGENLSNTESPDSSNELVATVTASSLNVRDHFTLSGNIVSKVKKGDKLTVVAEENNWCQVILPDGSKGWVAGWYLDKTTTIPLPETDTKEDQNSYVTVLYNTTNIRNGPSTGNDVIHRANQGDTFTILEKVDDWYKISIDEKTSGYVAGWIVLTTGNIPKVEKPGMNQYFSGRTIVIDPGHGGRDSGAKGVNGTLEKVLTLRTAKLLDEKLRAAGAKTILTRSQDVYVSLTNRVSFAHYYQADAFLSLHYDSSVATSAKGATVYYYQKNKDHSLGKAIHTELIKQTKLSDRGVVYGNFHVLRENKRPSILLELGFLSNGSEERHLVSSQYQEQATTAIFNGLAHYFKK
ncbi:SH3 domain-containing protein [Bacillus salitolerans]|uniref:SH3 domain-containing protein n=1 Tax=Bacillus salitolerans TaxID=1437434 RepID=A0ABW4LPJ6_9BACI